MVRGGEGWQWVEGRARSEGTLSFFLVSGLAQGRPGRKEKD